MKIKLLASAVLIAASSLSNAANYIISNVSDGLTDTLFATSDNQLSSGGVVTLGVFATGFDVTANLLDYAALTSNFTTIFASGATGGASGSLSLLAAPGYTENEAVDTTPLLTGNALIGRTLYLFAGNLATLATSPQLALLNMGSLQNEDGGELEYVANPSFRVGAPVIGVLGTKTGDFGGQGESTFTTLQMQAIPEPSAALLGVIGALGLLRRRRN
jgi:hypothetical protein